MELPSGMGIVPPAREHSIMRRIILAAIDRIEYAPHLWIWPFFGPCIGMYIDVPNKTLYICPVPMFGIKVKWRMEKV